MEGRPLGHLPRGGGEWQGGGEWKGARSDIFLGEAVRDMPTPCTYQPIYVDHLVC